MAATYEVSGPLAIIPDDDGKQHYLYQGATVPDGFPVEHLERLEADGLLTKVDEAKSRSKAPEKAPAKVGTGEKSGDSGA